MLTMDRRGVKRREETSRSPYEALIWIVYILPTSVCFVFEICCEKHDDDDE
jgi:hypothetical protein